MVSLEPVVEFEPSAYSRGEHVVPRMLGSEDPEGWHEYWKRCLADSSITDLEPIHVGSWLVATSQLVSEPTLHAWIEELLSDDPESLDEVPHLAGGFVLRSGEVSIEPSCCGDLSNLDEWREAARHVGKAWKQVWIGHPWTHVREVDGFLEFTEPSEFDLSQTLPDRSEDREPPPVVLRVDRRELESAIDGARTELNRLRGRLGPHLGSLSRELPATGILDRWVPTP